MKFCPKCGFEVESSEDFCGNCGFNFGSVDLSDKTQFLDRRQPVIQPLEDMIPDEPQTVVAKEEPTEAPKKKSKALILILVIIGVLIIAAGTLYILESKDIINFLDGIGSDKADEASSEASTDESGNPVYTGETEKKLVNTRVDHSNGRYTLYHYDSYGRLYLIEDLNSDGTAFITEKNTYDEKGNMISSEQTVSYGGEEAVQRYEYTYDEQGNNVTTTALTGDTVDWSFKYTYDSDGNMLTKEFRNKGGQYEYCEYTYSSDGKCLTETEYDSEKNIVYTKENSYDSNGNIILKLGSDKDGNAVQRYEYTYDDKGNVLTEYHNSMYDMSYHEYTYDESGNMLTHTKYEADKETVKDHTVYTWEEIDVPVGTE